MYKPISRRLALAGYHIRYYWAALHLGRRNFSAHDGSENPWLGYPSLASIQMHLNDWAFPLRIHTSHAHGSRPGGVAFKNGKTMALVHVTVSVTVLCFSVSVLVYRHADRDVQ